ncbi:MAG: condensation domain-containing protein, partial [Cyanobacteria bacterium J06638_6]
QTSAKEGLIHMRCTLRGEVDSTLLEQAWDAVVGQQAVLRTSVHWEGVKQPLQVVARKVAIPWTHLDWRSREDSTTALADFLVQDRELGFELTQAPISRLALIRLNETAYELIWSCHHLMLDGWSGALVFNQVFDWYEQLRQGKPATAAAAPTYQSYIRWLKQQDNAAAAEFWKGALKGFLEPTALPIGPATGEVSHTPAPAITFSAEVTARMQGMLRSHRLTLNTLMQGIWALLLHSYSGNPDVLFGATVSGRQGDLAGVEAIVGLLINVLPVRVQVAPEQTVLEWLQTLQTQQAQASRYGYASPDQIQSWSQVSGRLFDSLLVIENYPIEPATERSFQVKNLQSGLVSTYGLTVIIKPGHRLTVMLRSEKSHSQAVAPLLEQFQTILEAITANPDRSVAQSLPSPPLMRPTAAPSEPMLSRDQLEGTFSAPSNPLELTLTQIWESVLGVSPLSVDDNFFDVGGDSLLAVQLFNQMQQQLDCALPLATLFQAPNVRKFAALLSQDQPVSQWSSLVPIQTSGFRLPFFFHGGSADALTWARFSQLLGTERPFYGLQRPDLDGSEVIHTTVEALATDCIREMRMVQPKGPYLVGGHCLGGAVAFEIAQHSRHLHPRSVAVA